MTYVPDIDLNGSGGFVLWDWLYRAPRYDKPHAPARWHDPDYTTVDKTAETVCGLTGGLHIPGIFSRMGKPRCANCCRLTGFPRGIGSPKNDDACRALLDAQEAAIEARAARPHNPTEETDA